LQITWTEGNLVREEHWPCQSSGTTSHGSGEENGRIPSFESARHAKL